MTTATLSFQPRYEVLAHIRATYSIAELEGEQGVYSATPEFVREHCGPVAISILDQVPGWYFDEANHRGLHPNIDVRVHRLYPGNIPAYPGLHCDANYRETYFGQPQPEHTKVSRHVICSVSTSPGGVSNTEFITQPSTAVVEADGGPSLWAQVDAQTRHLPAERIPDGALVLFDSSTLHTATPARTRGWRLFFRMAMWYRPNLDGGKLSRQEMVYLPTDKVGW